MSDHGIVLELGQTGLDKLNACSAMPGSANCFLGGAMKAPVA
jgi:hypothetical protein